MQKALRINLLARNNYLKKSRKSLAKTRKGEEKQFEQAQSTRSKILRDQRRGERRDRRDDWISGDLAANRNTGLTKGALGAVHISEMSTRQVPRGVLAAPKDLAESSLGWREDWEGEGNEWNIIVGDKVCVVRGVEGVVGQIGVVKDVQPEKGELTVANVNMADVRPPEYLNASQAGRSTQSTELPLRFADVRLVVQMTDEKGRRDVIVRYLRGGAPYHSREYGSNVPRHTRYIAGEDVELAWPDAEIYEREREEVDTVRLNVEEVTYTPSVQSAPLPPGVENELFNPYRRNRTIHNKEWVQKKIVEDARSAWYEQRRIVTPREMAMEKMAKERKVEGLESAKQEMWTVIQEEMQQQQQQHARV